jgi:hypothetical protein
VALHCCRYAPHATCCLGSLCPVSAGTVQHTQQSKVCLLLTYFQDSSRQAGADVCFMLLCCYGLQGEAGTGNVVEAVRHARAVMGAIRALQTMVSPL